MTQLPLFSAPDTLAIERARLLRERTNPAGTECACCGRRVKEYHRPMNSGQVKALLWLVRTQGDSGDFVDVQGRAPRDVLRAKDYSLLAHWGLIEPMPATTTGLGELRRLGCWRATQLGIDFARGAAKVKSHAVIYANVLLRLEGEMVSLLDVLPKGFDYREIVACGCDGDRHAEVDVSVPVGAG